MDAAVVETIRTVSHFAPASGWNRARPRRIGRRGASSSDNHQSSVLGHRLSPDFWIGNSRGHDADHGGHCAALRLFAAAFCAGESRPRRGFRIRKRRGWIISVLPDRFRRRIVYGSPELDSKVAGFGSTDFSLWISANAPRLRTLAKLN